MVDHVQASSEFVVDNNHAYSAVVVQDFSNSVVYGRICAVQNNFFFSRIHLTRVFLATDEIKTFGQLLLFQTR